MPTESDGELERLRSEMLKAEDRIVSDIQDIRMRFSKKNMRNLLISKIREELFRRIETMNTKKIREAGNDVLTSTVETLRNHSAVTALVGMGISWFLADNFLKRKPDGGRVIEQLQEKVAQLEEESRRYAESNLPNLKESAKETAELVSRKSQTVLDGVSSYVQEKLPRIRETAKETGDVIAMKSQNVLEEISGYMTENPLMSGFIGLSAGLILGILTSGFLSGNGLLEDTKRDVQKNAGRIFHESGHIVDEVRDAASIS